MPHNHSPRCCCEHTYNGAIVTSAKPCPSCIEHGELATLGNNAPFIDCPQCDARADGTPCTHRPPADATLTPDEDGLVRFGGVVGRPVEHHSAETMDDWLEDHRQKPNPATQPAECPSCHAVGDQPHTDYCRLPLTDALRLATRTIPPGYQVRHFRPDESPILYAALTGNRYELNGEPVRLDDDVDCTTRERSVLVCLCTTSGSSRCPIHGLGPNHTARTAQAQTSQPAATTSQPPTQTRGGRIVDHPMSPPHPLTAACAPLCNHTGYATTPPPPIDDYPR